MASNIVGKMDFIILFEFAVFSVAFVLMAYFASYIVRYRSKNKNLDTNYECGMLPEKTKQGSLLEKKQDDTIQYKPSFIIYAMIFLLFEAECILIFPYAFGGASLGMSSLYGILAFIFILAFALFYAIKSGLLDIK